ncbi:MAG: GNAT family N-acetyltransferase, partial [Chitinophagaceae bacterium]|nr:GNAT family N-acetyltransferase [Chitinophagaceae bacterium]
VGLVQISKEVVKLRKMYVSSELRGKGFGLQLLKTAVHQARCLGYKIIRLETVHTMREAIQLYTKFGFDVVLGHPCSPRCDIVMQMNL